MKKLDNREQRFVHEYLACLDPKEAALRAGYSATVARTKAYQWVSKGESKPHVYAAIREGQAKTAKKLSFTRDEVLEQYRRIGFADPRKLYDAYGQLKPIHELDDDTAAAVQQIEVVMQQVDGPDSPPVPVLKVRLGEKKGALDSIMRAQGWNMPDKMEHTGKDGGPIQTETRVVLVPPKKKAEVTVKPLKTDGEEG